MARFGLPSSGRSRSGSWFRIGSLDVDSTTLLCISGAVSMFLWAFSPPFGRRLGVTSDQVLRGEIYQLVTWPLSNPPSIFLAISLYFTYTFARPVEDFLGRVRMAKFIGALTVIPAVIAVIVDQLIEDEFVALGGFSMISLCLLTAYAIEYPNARFFFGIPAWVIASVLWTINLLQLLESRVWGNFVLLLATLAVTTVGLRWMGLASSLSFIPPNPFKARPTARTTVTAGRFTPPSKAARLVRNPKSSKPPKGDSGPATVTPIRREQPVDPDIDRLLDKISASGIDSLTAEERHALDQASRRMRGSE